MSLIILILFSMFLLIIFGDNGLVDFVLIKGEKDSLIEKNEKLNQENLVMYREIDRLKNDPKFVENVVRQELGVIGKNEIIFKTEQKK
ncbi:MAG: septum formation initiator family protein [Desulfobacteraceae bacterium]|nr:septum formation initiator family protein [Pseudomonadota bacterium]MBU4463274.1 septum formation initiator family protein [Pseudomonadota bacterium]MCG2754001.1 septum formation initiator family protein [Desulfobacteraceae bacterium]